MSAKAGSIGGIVLGAVEVVVGVIASIYGFGAGVPMIIGGALMIGGGAVALAFGAPAAQNPAAANASQLKFATTQEGTPVPVIFGEQKVVPQFMNWSAKEFTSQGIEANTGGKGGGPSQISGYNYFLPFEVGICMGPVDEIGQIVSVPGDMMMRGNVWIDTNINILNNHIFASQTGTAVTANTAIFTSSMVGAQIVYEDDSIAIITHFTDSTHVTVDTSFGLTDLSFQIYANPPQIVFGSDDSEDVEIQGAFLTSNATSYTEGGTVRIYKGSSTQVRDLGGDPYATNYPSGRAFNYRNMCWAMFLEGFQIGQNSPVPKTYQFIVRRYPKCVRDDGTTVTGLLTRGSTDSTNPSYNAANPAAIIYEILTNSLWGRGCSSSMIDETSFIAASSYYAAKNLGLSLTIDSAQKMTSFLNAINQHVKSVLSWKNGLWSLRCILDVNEIASTILTLDAGEVSDLQVTRPLWPATINDLRVEFTNRARLYKQDIAHVQDLANMQLTGRINAQTITLPGFTEFNTALQQAWRIMRESSYPLAQFTFKINRFHSQLEIGDIVRLQWSEWGADAATVYLEISQLDPQGVDDEEIAVTAMESTLICPVAGLENSVTLPTVQPWEKVVPISSSDLSFFGGGSQSGGIEPIVAFEMPAIWTKGKSSQVLIIGQRPGKSIVGMAVMYSQTASLGQSKYASLGVSKQTSTNSSGALWGCSATLTTAPATQTNFDRTPEFFQFTINDITDDLATFLAVNSVVNYSDDLEDLANSKTDYFIIGEEILMIGCVELVSGFTYRCRNVIRGCFGTPIQQHNIGDTLFLVQNLFSGFDASSLGENVTTKFIAHPIHGTTVEQVGTDFYIYHPDPQNQQFIGVGTIPLSPERISIQRLGTSTTATFTATVRPRFFDSGAGTNPLIGEFNSTTQKVQGTISGLKLQIGTMTFQVHCYGADGTELLRNPTLHTFVSEQFDISANVQIGYTSSGLATIANIPAFVNGTAVKRVEIYSYLNTQLSQRAAIFAV